MAVHKSGVFGRGDLDERLDKRIVVECFLLVKQGLRPVAIVTIPAELPDGNVLGAQVDFEFRTRLAGQARDLRTRMSDTLERRRLSPIAFKTSILRSSFANNVLGSESYLVHREVARALGLEVLESEVRPTIREWYVHLPGTRDRLKTMLSRRHEIQKQARQHVKSTEDVGYYVYPEERDPDYLQDLGALLGYPDCCVKAYTAGRAEGDGRTPGMPEERSARQLREAGVREDSLEAGGNIPAGVSPWAFWLKDFYPCRPDCPAAVTKGEQARAALGAFSEELTTIYEGFCRGNLARVLRGPETIRQHEEWLGRRP